MRRGRFAREGWNTHLLGAAFISPVSEMAAASSGGLLDCFNLDPEGAGVGRRAETKISRRDLRDFRELASMEGREGRGRGEKERGGGVSSWKWGARSTVVAIRWTLRDERRGVRNK